MARGGKRPGAGRPTGSPNKATADVRESVACFARGSVGELQAKFDAIADPARWVDLWARVVEYHIPKLGRTEVTGKDGGPVVIDFSVDLGAAIK